MEKIEVNKDGVITVTGQNITALKNNKTITLTPYKAANSTQDANKMAAADFAKNGTGLVKAWVCGGTVEARFCPASCR